MCSENYSAKLFTEARALGRRLEEARGRLESALDRAEHIPITHAAPEVLEAERDIHILESSLRYGFGVHSFPAGRADT